MTLNPGAPWLDSFEFVHGMPGDPSMENCFGQTVSDCAESQKTATQAGFARTIRTRDFRLRENAEG